MWKYIRKYLLVLDLVKNVNELLFRTLNLYTADHIFKGESDLWIWWEVGNILDRGLGGWVLFGEGKRVVGELFNLGLEVIVVV